MIDFSPFGQEAIGKLKSLQIHPINEDRKSFRVPLPEAGGRRLVIPDIHGCFQTFIKLLDKINLQKEDQLFLLGDLIDRGPYSYNVIIKVWELLNESFQVYPLRGNHEQIFIDLSLKSQSELLTFADKQYTRHLLTKDLRFRPVMRNFFRALPFFYETGDHLLVHAGFNSDKENMFQSYRDMLWIRSFRTPQSKFGNKKIIHGHVPTGYKSIQQRLKERKTRICLDNGCVQAGRTAYGKLLCLNLDTYEVITQKNVDLTPN